MPLFLLDKFCLHPYTATEMPEASLYISFLLFKQGDYTPPRVADLRLPQALKRQVYHLSLPVLSMINSAIIQNLCFLNNQIH